MELVLLFNYSEILEFKRALWKLRENFKIYTWKSVLSGYAAQWVVMFRGNINVIH